MESPESTSLVNGYTTVLGGVMLVVLTFLWEKGKELLADYRSRRRKNPVLIARKDKLVDELLVQIRTTMNADSACLWQKDVPTLDQVRYSVTHEREHNGVSPFREEMQNLLQYDINDVFLKLQEHKVWQIDREKTPDDWKLKDIMQHRKIYDVVLALVYQKDNVLGFIWLSYHYENIPDISEAQKEKLKEYARQMAYRLINF